MKRKITKGVLKGVIALLMLFTVVVGCEYEKREPVDPNALPEVVSFSVDVVPVFEAKCNTCHGGSQPPNLTIDYAYSDLTGGNFINTEMPESSKLYEEITEGGMSSYANDNDRALILKWIVQGAEDN